MSIICEFPTNWRGNGVISYGLKTKLELCVP